MSILPPDKSKPPRDLGSWIAWERRQRSNEDKIPELGFLGQLLEGLYAVAAHPLKALIHTRRRMKRARQVRDMLHGPTDEGINGRE